MAVGRNVTDGFECSGHERFCGECDQHTTSRPRNEHDKVVGVLCEDKEKG